MDLNGRQGFIAEIRYIRLTASFADRLSLDQPPGNRQHSHPVQLCNDVPQETLLVESSVAHPNSQWPSSETPELAKILIDGWATESPLGDSHEDQVKIVHVPEDLADRHAAAGNKRQGKPEPVGMRFPRFDLRGGYFMVRLQLGTQQLCHTKHVPGMREIDQQDLHALADAPI